MYSAGWVREVVQWARMSASKSNDPSSIPRIHMVERELLKVVF